MDNFDVDDFLKRLEGIKIEIRVSEKEWEWLLYMARKTKGSTPARIARQCVSTMASFETMNRGKPMCHACGRPQNNESI